MVRVCERENGRWIGKWKRVGAGVGIEIDRFAKSLLLERVRLGDGCLIFAIRRKRRGEDRWV